MFKLLKIFNSGSNVPENIRMPIMNSNPAAPGTLLYLTSDGYVESGYNPSAPLFIAVEQVDESLTEVICYRITPDMLFEAPMFDGYDSAYTGSPLTPILTSDGFGGVKLAESEGEAAATLCYCVTVKSGDNVLLTFNK